MRGRLRRHFAGAVVAAERLWPYDMIGNGWTADWWSAKYEPDVANACCIPENPRGGSEQASYDPCQPAIRIPRKVLKAAGIEARQAAGAATRPAARHASR